VERLRLVKEELAYRCGDLLVTPCRDASMLAVAYLRWAQDGTLPILFYEGVPDLRWWLDWTDNPKNNFLACMRTYADGRDPEFIGMGWINTVTQIGRDHRKAEVGFAFFDGYSPLAKVRFGQMMLEWAFERVNVNVCYGTTPLPNALAIRYAQLIGMKIEAQIPNFTTWKNNLCSVAISMAERDAWRSEWVETEVVSVGT